MCSVTSGWPLMMPSKFSNAYFQEYISFSEICQRDSLLENRLDAWAIAHAQVYNGRVTRMKCFFSPSHTHHHRSRTPHNQKKTTLAEIQCNHCNRNRIQTDDDISVLFQECFFWKCSRGRVLARAPPHHLSLSIFVITRRAPAPLPRSWR
jgi:hypothetical protein